MATGIEVIFTGLMLICLEGQAKCPATEFQKDGYVNTSWVIRADGKSRTCGWSSREETELEIQYNKLQFNGPPVDNLNLTCAPGRQTNDVICSLSNYNEICLEGLRYSPPQAQPSLRGLPKIDEIDRRLWATAEDRLMSHQYVPTRIHFPKGSFTAGDIWKSVGSYPVRWYRTNGEADGAFPRELSDRLIASYQVDQYFSITDCHKQKITFKPNDGARIIFQNVSRRYPPTPDYDDEAGYESLAYLLWYYRLGRWHTPSGQCPYYTRDKKDAVLLRCVSSEDADCAYNPGAAADTRYWPPMLGPSPK